MPQTITVITTIALQPMLERMAACFRQATGSGIAMAFGPPSKAVQMVLDGEPGDVVIAAPDGIETLRAAGKLADGPAPVVTKLIMGVAARAGAPKPDISTAEKFKHAMLAAKSLVHANPASGSPSAAHFLKIVNQLGIAAEVKAKAILRSGVIARAVATGEAELAIQQMAELMMAEGVDIVGPLPDELQNVVPLAAAVVKTSSAPDAARALIDLLATPEAMRAMEATGLLPP